MRLIMMFTGNKIQFSKYSMVLDPQDRTGSFYFICNYLFGAPCLEHLEIKLFMGLIAANPNTKVVDVGANYGYYTLEACTLMQEPESIIAVEPDDQVFSRLSSSVKYSGFEDKVVLANVAISDTDGQKMALVSERSESALNKTVAHFSDGSSRANTVDSITLDSLLKQHYKLNEHRFVIKIDIEGSEPLAFAGMHEILSTSRGYAVFFEFTPESVTSSGRDPLEFGRSILVSCPRNS